MLLISLVAGTIDKLTEEFKEASPEEKELLIKSSINLLEVFTSELKMRSGLYK